ncbi:MAG: hypothetical protein PHS54_07460 [Clostridia bacterium]|nr:hypothetical protein [Clostridia bacterium]
METIYTINEIQSVWKQFYYFPETVQISENSGQTWQEPPSMDTGKWALFTIDKDGNRVDWVYRFV